MKSKSENVVSMIFVGDLSIQRDDPELTFSKTPPSLMLTFYGQP